tara:strand:- start:10582 stop:12852 length:2271 start_codon:yes stop_codon:yes gene_type:complete
MLRIVSSLFTFFFLVFQLSAQINTEEFPPSFYSPELLPEESMTAVELEKPNVSVLLKEDAAHGDKIEGWRFGTLIPVNYTIENSGTLQKITSNNSFVWTLKIKVKDAISINLNFDDFFLSNNAKLFIYNQDYSDVLGALTHKNNKKDGQFSIRPIVGDEITLELHLPDDELEANRISIHQLIYGYRNLLEKSGKTFGGSGSCNINVNCKEGKLWQDVKRSVVLITRSNNTRICTGTLVNNLRQDSTPYILTAAHCGIATNSIFVFNYESASCTPSVNGSISNSISGASNRAIAVNFGSDFHLFELSSKPPPSYNVFYAGWSAVNQAAPKSVAIHHPNGDVKKVSFNNDPLTSSGYYDPTGDKYWMVRNWEKGTTEQGSSGSALFDYNLRIVGQLFGGDALCSNQYEDYYGKFSHSWNSDTSNFRRLKPWLDPDNTQFLTVNGFDPNPANFQNDLQLLYIGGVPNFMCGDSAQPFVIIRNRGANTATSIRLDYQLNNQAVQSIVSNSPIARQQLLRIDLPMLQLSNGLNKIDARVFYNSSTIDQDTSDNFNSLTFESNSNAVNLNLIIKTDDFGSETSWMVFSPNGSKVAEGGPYVTQTGGQINQHAICVFDSCFTLRLIDKGSDGFNVPAFGNGFALVTNVFGDTLLFENSFTTEEKNVTFCVHDSLTSLNEVTSTNFQFKVFPNPIKKGQLLQIETNAPLDNQKIVLFDLSGRIVFSSYSNSLVIPQSISSGIYFIRITELNSNTIISNEKLIIH